MKFLQCIVEAHIKQTKASSQDLVVHGGGGVRNIWEGCKI